MWAYATAKKRDPFVTFLQRDVESAQFGRGKYQNVYIYGPANSGKSFLVSPLKSVFKTFTKPATGTFAWMGVEDAEVVLLNDFRWHPSIIAWGDFLQLLEGDTVHIPAPRNVCSQDIEFSKVHLSLPRQILQLFW